jgi:hypothetical protein
MQNLKEQGLKQSQEYIDQINKLKTQEHEHLKQINSAHEAMIQRDKETQKLLDEKNEMIIQIKSEFKDKMD